MSYRIASVTDERSWQDFLELPERIYRHDPHWVAPLRSEIRRVLAVGSNPYLTGTDLCPFVCYRSAVPVARAILLINRRHWQRWQRRSAFFGFFEAEEDPAAVAQLFEALEGYGRERGAAWLEGPFNPNHYSELGLLTGPFDTPPRYFDTYNPCYYPPLLEGLGYSVQTRLHTRINLHTDRFVEMHPHTFPSGRTDHGFSIRTFDLRNRAADLERIREVNNDAFSENWHFLPLSSEEYRYTSKFLFFATRPELVLIVERAGEPVGVLTCVLDINEILQPLRGRLRVWRYPSLFRKRRRIRAIVIHAIGIKKRYQNSAAFRLMYEAMCKIVRRYPIVSTTWMTDDNLPALRAADLLGLRPHKRFAIYEKQL